MTSGPLIWGYETAPGSAIDGRTMVYPQARVLGGGSSINAQVFTRGCPRGLRRLGATKRAVPAGPIQDVLPYFKRSEGNDTWPAISMASTGRSASAREAASADPRLRAGGAAGRHSVHRRLQRRQAGRGRVLPDHDQERPAQQHGGRLSQAGAGRKNLIARGPTLLVTRIVIEGGRAIGVEIIENGSVELLRAEREVIVTAGAIGSPKLLMLSGIGPAGASQRHRACSVVHDLPGVGQNLQDHMDVDVLAELSGSLWHRSLQEDALASAGRSRIRAVRQGAGRLQHRRGRRLLVGRPHARRRPTSSSISCPAPASRKASVRCRAAMAAR